MEELIRNLEAAEDALDTYRANARLSKITDPEAEQRLIDSVNDAKAKIADFKSRKEAFWAKAEHESKLMIKRHAEEHKKFVAECYEKAQELGYDN